MFNIFLCARMAIDRTEAQHNSNQTSLTKHRQLQHHIRCVQSNTKSNKIEKHYITTAELLPKGVSNIISAQKCERK